MRIETLPFSNDKSRRLSDLEEIFWVTASKAPKSQEDRNKFLYKYHKMYIEHWPEDVYYAVDDISNKTMGYLLGCRNTIKALPIFEPYHAYFRIFEKHFKKYPAHLHMDVHPEFQGRGVGTFLIGQYFSDLESAKIKGLHIINSPTERSVAFYRRSGLTFEVVSHWNGIDLLFMAKTI